jgi:hypothetical protein
MLILKIPAVINLPSCFCVILAQEKHSRFRITSMEDFVVKGCSTVMLIQLEEDTLKQGILVLVHLSLISSMVSLADILR